MNASRWTIRFLILAGISFLVFCLIAWGITPPSRLIDWDERLSHRLFEWCFQRPSFYDAVEDWSKLGTTPFLYFLGALPIAYLLWKQENFLAVLFFAFEIATRRLHSDLKLQFTRLRPFHEEIQQLGDYSFPSGHALATTAIVTLCLFLVVVYCKPLKLRVTLLGLGILFILSIAATRVLLGVHHFLDVSGGVAFGLGWAFLGCAICEWRRPKLISPAQWNPITDAPKLGESN